MSDVGPPPLRNRRVVVCRSERQAGSLIDRLVALGADVVHLPLIEVVPPVDLAPLDRRIERLADYDWVCLTSSNGVDAVAAAVERNGATWPATTRVAVVGEASRRAAEAAGLTVAFAPVEATAAALATELPLSEGGSPDRVLAPLAELAGPDLTTLLTERGARVDPVTAYRTIAPDLPVDQVALAAAADAALLTSGSTVDRLIAAVGVEGLPPVLVAIGPTTAEVVRAHGLEAAAVADPHTEDGLIEALVRSLSP